MMDKQDLRNDMKQKERERERKTCYKYWRRGEEDDSEVSKYVG